MVSRFAIHDDSGWTPRLVLRRAPESEETERVECAPKRTEESWILPVLKTLEAFPEALTAVRRTILRLGGYLRDEASP